MQEMALRILKYMREQSMVRFPAFPEAFGILEPEMQDGLSEPLGTDGKKLYYAPEKICRAFAADSDRLLRLWIHLHMHCLLRHPAQSESLLSAAGKLPGNSAKKDLVFRVDLAADLIACCCTELLMDAGPKAPSVRRTAHTGSDQGTSVLSRLYRMLPEFSLPAAQLPLLAERIGENEELKTLAAECAMDDHAFWPAHDPFSPSEPEMETCNGNTPGSGSGRDKHSSALSDRVSRTLEKTWEDLEKKLFAEAAQRSGKRGRQAGNNVTDVKLQRKDEISYHQFLQRFMVPREEAILDVDSFDYIPYYYGFTHYKNLTFLEPLEYKEVNRLDEFAIAIDTSASCSGPIVRRFLEETWNIFRQKENFFSRMRLHFIQCDSMVQEYRVFRSLEEWEDAMTDFKVLGQGNTDFCPVFELLDRLIEEKEIRNLRGLLYFSDGDGIFPRKAPAYDTAFVFLNDQTEKHALPDWAIRLNLHLPDVFASEF